MNMFNLFPKKKSVDEIVNDANLTPSWQWTPTQTPSVLQAQSDLIEQFLKENHDLKCKNQKLKNEINKWEKDWDEQNKNVSELIKEVNGLRYLKEENVQLMERLQKNAEKNVPWIEAKLQIIQNDYKKCTEQRDEYKHQLDAANKEIETLKSKLRDWEDKYARSFSNNDMDKLQKEIDQLKRWKKEQLTVQSWWDKVDSYVRDHDDAPLGGFVANTCLNFLKERDRQKEEIAKLKQDIVDYVIVKDDRIEQLQKELHHMKAVAEGAISLCDLSDKTDYDLAMNEIKKTQDWNKVVHGVETEKVIDWMADEGVPNDEEEPQKHPMYPIHWGGWDKVEITTSSTDAWNCPCNKCKDKRENKEEKTWEQAAADLALRVVKLEKQIEELKFVKTNSDPNYEYFKKNGKWPWNNEHTK
jgi:predicted  nucleic acid-binding Zn-ribbon protein